jgi:hypothetical protein
MAKRLNRETRKTPFELSFWNRRSIEAEFFDWKGFFNIIRLVYVALIYIYTTYEKRGVLRETSPLAWDAIPIPTPKY